MIKIPKKKTPTKWNRAHEFKRKKSNKNGVGHPVYIYGKNKRSFKYLLFTHKIPDDAPDGSFVQLKHNIDPDKDGVEPTYMKTQHETNRRDAFENVNKKYRIHDEDKDTVKRYKK